MDIYHALSEAISSLGCWLNSSDGSVLIKQLDEVQLLNGSKTANLGVSSVYWTGYHLSQLLWDSGLRWHPVQWTENHMSQLHLNTWDWLEFNQLTQLNIDRKVTEMIIYNGVSYFFWECGYTKQINLFNQMITGTLSRYSSFPWCTWDRYRWGRRLWHLRWWAWQGILQWQICRVWWKLCRQTILNHGMYS